MHVFKRVTWVKDLAEALPSIVFIALWRGGVGLEAAGWIAALLSAMVLFLHQVSQTRSNPLFLGINIHLLLVTPVIVGIHSLGMHEVGRFLETNSYNGVFVTILATGGLLTLFSPRGFIGLESRQSHLPYSLILLAASAIAAAWSFAFAGPGVLSVALPATGLFILRRVLIAHAKGASGLLGLAVAPVAGGMTAAWLSDGS
ncbi:hypothetical protein [Nitratireductor thuwali]|uniref:Uncharacterized protein n=1 Tax=Nitratireductor thuwali TaxID=2267699 RepID=A0ABY5MG99_9HYPH|nr:hypothetical protein NTH_00729 [Nitratireductor thuwali]